METQCRDQKIFPIIGILTFFLLLYLNFNDDFDNSKFSVITRNLPKMGFAGVNHTRFVVEDEAVTKEVYVNGWNSYWLMEESASRDHASRRRVSEMMRRGAQMGLTVCRTWAFNDGSGPNGLQLHPGVFDERVFQALDYVLLQARKNKIRLILSLVNNLNAYGGKAQYLKWAEKAAAVNVSAARDLFFSHPVIKGYYKNYVRAVITRKNSYTGVKYSDDPSIFAWELINEPRCGSVSCGPDLQAWITEMAAYVKSLDKNHLVTVGVEGFYGQKSTDESSSSNGANPGLWAASLGSDFINNSAVKDIDFASVHAYPHSWIPQSNLEEKNKYLSKWVDAHIMDGEALLKKPVLFTEMGSPLPVMTNESNDRDILLKTVYDKIYESAKKREAGAGVLIWQLLVEGVEYYTDEFALIPSRHPSTYELILEQSRRLCGLYHPSNQTSARKGKDPCYQVTKHV